MFTATAVRWWPPVGLVAMLLLGWLVGTGSTPVDQPFSRDFDESGASGQRWLLIFTDWRLLSAVLAGCMIVALYRREWRTAVAVLACPLVALALVYVFKRLFDRTRGDGLAYPSGHTTQVVVAMGLVVLVVGARLWVVAIAIAVSLLGMLGMIALGYHYMTDTVGGVLLGTAVVCVAAQLAGVSTPASRTANYDECLEPSNIRGRRTPRGR